MSSSRAAVREPSGGLTTAAECTWIPAAALSTPQASSPATARGENAQYLLRSTKVRGAARLHGRRPLPGRRLTPQPREFSWITSASRWRHGRRGSFEPAPGSHSGEVSAPAGEVGENSACHGTNEKQAEAKVGTEHRCGQGLEFCDLTPRRGPAGASTTRGSGYRGAAPAGGEVGASRDAILAARNPAEGVGAASREDRRRARTAAKASGGPRRFAAEAAGAGERIRRRGDRRLRRRWGVEQNGQVGAGHWRGFDVGRSSWAEK